MMVMGRPTKLDDKLTIEICKLIELGVSPPVAAECCGITKQSFYNWMERGEEAKTGKHRDFFDKIEQSKAIAVKECIVDIKNSKDWKAKAWLVERLDRFSYGTVKKVELEHSGSVNNTVTFNPIMQDEILEEEGYDGDESE